MIGVGGGSPHSAEMNGSGWTLDTSLMRDVSESKVPTDTYGMEAFTVAKSALP